jgi:hypothetical protein
MNVSPKELSSIPIYARDYAQNWAYFVMGICQNAEGTKRCCIPCLHGHMKKSTGISYPGGQMGHQIKAFFLVGLIAMQNHKFCEVIERKRKDGWEDVEGDDSM